MSVEAARTEFDDGDQTTRFRILRVGDRRKGFSLEPIFWTMLETVARERNLSLGELMNEIIEHKGAANMSSALRTAGAQFVYEQFETMRDATLVALGRRVTALIPSPAFIIERQKRIIAANNQLINLLKSEGQEPSTALDAEIRLGAPVPRLLALFEEKPQAIFRLDYTISNARVSLSGRLSTTLFESSPSAPSILCVISPEELKVTDKTRSPAL